MVLMLSVIYVQDWYMQLSTQCSCQEVQWMLSFSFCTSFTTILFSAINTLWDLGFTNRDQNVFQHLTEELIVFKSFCQGYASFKCLLNPFHVCYYTQKKKKFKKMGLHQLLDPLRCKFKFIELKPVIFHLFSLTPHWKIWLDVTN